MFRRLLRRIYRINEALTWTQRMPQAWEETILTLLSEVEEIIGYPSARIELTVSVFLWLNRNLTGVPPSTNTPNDLSIPELAYYNDPC